MRDLVRLSRNAKELFVFEAAARSGSLTATAREYNISQPSVSRAIAKLEAEIGVRLFDRSPRGVVPTKAGEELFRHVSAGFEQIQNAFEVIRSERLLGRRTVTMSFSSSFVSHWLLPRIAAFKAIFPNIDLQLDLCSGVMNDIPRSVDLATRIVENETDYRYWNLAPELILPVCSPAYAERHGLLAGDQAAVGHIFLNLTDHRPAQWDFICRDLAGRNGVRSVWHQFSDYSVILEAAMKGEGIALGWVSVVSRALLEGTLVPASERSRNTGRIHRLIAPKRRAVSSAVVEISEWLVAQMSADIEGLRPALDVSW